MFRFMLSKKGFTVVELMTAVFILSVLVALAVPAYTGVVNAQKKKDCANQREIIEAAVIQAMNGMMDNGKKQKKIYFENITDPSHKTVYPDTKGDGDDQYEGMVCLMLVGEYMCSKDSDRVQNMSPLPDPEIKPFTLGDLRGGYRDLSVYPDYKDGCDYANNYLKKQRLENEPFYNVEIMMRDESKTEDDENKYKFYPVFYNGEIPICPFSDYTNKEANGNFKTEDDYYYYIISDDNNGTSMEAEIKVLCSCEHCH